MARKVEEILREMLGAQQLQLAQLVADNERMKDELQAKLPKRRLRAVPASDDAKQAG